MLTTGPVYHGDRARFHYYQCLQLLFRKQVAALTTLWKLPPEFEVCRPLGLASIMSMFIMFRQYAETYGYSISTSFPAHHLQNLSITPESRKGINVNPRTLERAPMVDRNLKMRIATRRRVLLRCLTENPLRAKMKCLPLKLQYSWKRIPKLVHRTTDLLTTSPTLGTTCTLHPKIRL